MADKNPILSAITLNINRLNSPIKRQRLEEYILKCVSTQCCLHENTVDSKAEIT